MYGVVLVDVLTSDGSTWGGGAIRERFYYTRSSLTVPPLYHGGSQFQQPAAPETGRCQGSDMWTWTGLSLFSTQWGRGGRGREGGREWGVGPRIRVHRRLTRTVSTIIANSALNERFTSVP